MICCNIYFLIAKHPEKWRKFILFGCRRPADLFFLDNCWKFLCILWMTILQSNVWPSIYARSALVVLLIYFQTLTTNERTLRHWPASTMPGFIKTIMCLQHNTIYIYRTKKRTYEIGNILTVCFSSWSLPVLRVREQQHERIVAHFQVI